MRCQAIGEVHVDSQGSFPSEFERYLALKDFRNDPFVVPGEGSEQFTTHWTYRWPISGKLEAAHVAGLRALMSQTVDRAAQLGLNLYAEAEVIHPRNSVRAPYRPRWPWQRCSLAAAFDRFFFERTGRFGGAAADIHVEFAADVVEDNVQATFLSHQFYPVTGTDPNDGVGYIVFTIQAETYGQGQRLYRDLLKAVGALAGFRELTLEQKLGMQQTGRCQMPEVIRVSVR